MYGINNNIINIYTEIALKYKNQPPENNILNYFELASEQCNETNADNNSDNTKGLFKALPNGCISHTRNFKMCSGMVAIICVNETNNEILITTILRIKISSNYLHKSIMNHSNNSAEYFQYNSSKKKCVNYKKNDNTNQLLSNKNYSNAYTLSNLKKQTPLIHQK